MTGPPIRDGWIDVEGGRIAQVGNGHSASVHGGHDPTGKVIDLGAVAVLPGLVNAHTHLELSSLRGQVPPCGSLPDWARHLIAARGEVIDLDDIRAAIAEARCSGTSLVGDISNTLAPVEPLREGPLGGVVFHEVIGFRQPNPEEIARSVAEAIAASREEAGVRIRIAAHAPYSVSPELFRALTEEVDRRDLLPRSVHLAESADEIEFLSSGRGKWRRLLEDLGAWNPAWEPPRSGPVEYLDGLGWIRAGTLVAHGVKLTDRELVRLAGAGATLVTCPRSNVWTGVGSPPVGRFYASGVRVAIGTDSLASCPDLNLFEELAAMRRLAPEVPARRLLESATRVGAGALGFDGDFGSIAAGQTADLIAVRIPDEESDVEEYLVRGIVPGQISWVSA
jgi:cytosine/adenosine deaminase-related metal-dependent hydrolase